MAAENEIYIDTGLDATDLENGIENIKKELAKLEKEYANLEEKKKRYLETGGEKQKLSEEFKKADALAEKYGTQLEKLLNRKERFDESGVNVDSQRYKDLKTQIEQVDKQFQEADKARKAFTEEQKYVDTSAWQKLTYDTEQTKNKIDNAKTVLTSYESQLEKMQSVEPTQKLLTGVDRVRLAFQGLGKITKNVFLGIVSGTKKAVGLFSKLGTAIIGATKKLKSFGKNGKSTFGQGLRNVLQYTIGISSLYMLFNKLRTAIVSGMKNLAQFNNGVNPTNQALSNLKSALTQLKNSFATAFAPILTAAAPALVTLINLVTKAVNAIGMLFAALTGAKTFTKATAVTEDFAAGLKDTAGGAKDAKKELDRYLSPLDDLNTMQKNSDAGGSGGGGAGGINPNQMFEEVAIPDSFTDIASKIKDAWENADFTEIGATIGRKLKDSLDNIDWAPIQATAEKIGKSIGTLINGFVETNGLGESIGKTLGEMINTGVDGITSFLDNTHWDSVGKFIGDGINGLVNAVNWENVGYLFGQKWNAVFETIGNFARTFNWKNLGSNIASSVNTWASTFKWKEAGVNLSDFAKGLLDTIIEFLENTNWNDIGKGIKEFVKGIDWEGLAEKIAEGIGAALGGLAALIWGLIEEEWNKVVEWWKENAYEDGEFTIEGLLKGITDILKNIGAWIKEHIFQPFIEGFKKAFGIHSPSKEMETMGGYIIDGLKNGINKGINAVVKLAKDIWSGIKGAFSNTVSFFKDKFGDAWTGIKSKFSISTIKNHFNSIRDGIKSAFSSIPNWFKTTFTTAWSNVKKVFSSGGKVFTGIKEGILSSLKSVINALINGINTVVATPFKGLNTALTKLKNVSIAGAKPFSFLPTVSVPKIPRLATGTVVPRSAQEFMAILGDNNRETEVVSPISTMKQAFKEAMMETGMSGRSGGSYIFQATMNRRVIFDEFITEAKLRQQQNGRNPFELT